MIQPHGCNRTICRELLCPCRMRHARLHSYLVQLDAVPRTIVLTYNLYLKHWLECSCAHRAAPGCSLLPSSQSSDCLECEERVWCRLSAGLTTSGRPFTMIKSWCKRKLATALNGL